MSTFSDLVGGSPLDVFNAWATWDKARQNTPSDPSNMQWDSASYLTMQKDLITKQQQVIDALSSSGDASSVIKNPWVWVGVAVVVGGILILKS